MTPSRKVGAGRARANPASIAKCWHLAVSQGDSPWPPWKGWFYMERNRKVTVRLSEAELARLRIFISGFIEISRFTSVQEGGILYV